MKKITAHDVMNVAIDMEHATPLYSGEGHHIYWLGIAEAAAFRCNVYLIKDHDEAILVDPGSRMFFPQIMARVAQVMAPDQVTGMILCHQDPDVAASMVDWLDVNPSIRVFTTPRTHILLPHYGRADYEYYDVSQSPRYDLPSGGHLRFVEAPFLHSPGAFASYDVVSRYLFSGDIWAALDLDWSLTPGSFDDHVQKMDLFHVDYMASNLAAQGFIKRLSGIPIDAILPQHGSVIGPQHVQSALHYLRDLRCGTDIVYADLER